MPEISGSSSVLPRRVSCTVPVGSFRRRQFLLVVAKVSVIGCVEGRPPRESDELRGPGSGYRGAAAGGHVAGGRAGHVTDGRRTTTTTTAMHSFRLRYVALGLLVYIQSAFSRTCGTDFDDLASSAVLADTVLLATATRRLSRGSAVRFRVERVYKGSIPEADVVHSGGRRKPSLVVAPFASTADREGCVAGEVTRGQRYIVFLHARNDADDSLSSRRRQRQQLVARRRRRLRISAFPVLVTDDSDVISVVEQYANCANHCRKYSCSV